MEDNPNETIQDDQRLRAMEQSERFGLQLFKKDHLFQYINFLKGLQLELEIGDFYGAKQYYIESLTKTVYVNHRIRKETLSRLLTINKKIGFPKESPEKTLISRYYIKQKYVQVLLDTSSFPNTKTLKQTMNLAKMLFNNLEDQDYFGLKILKNGYNPELVAMHGVGGQKQGNDKHNDKLTIPVNQYQQDVIVLESKNFNSQVKAQYLEDFTQELKAHNKQSASYYRDRVSGRDAQARTKEMQKQTLHALTQTINKVANISEYNVDQVNGEWIKGPMKWLVVILGPNHQAKELRTLLNEEYKNLNIIVILIANSNKDIGAVRNMNNT